MTVDEAKSLGEAALEMVRAHVGHDDLDADFMIADLQTGLDMLHGMVLRLEEALRVSAEALSVQTALKRQADEHAERQWNAALDDAAANCATCTAVFDDEACEFFAGMCRQLKRPVGHDSCPDSPCSQERFIDGNATRQDNACQADEFRDVTDDRKCDISTCHKQATGFTSEGGDMYLCDEHGRRE